MSSLQKSAGIVPDGPWPCAKSIIVAVYHRGRSHRDEAVLRRHGNEVIESG